MDDKEWAAGIEMALNSALSFLPKAWAALPSFVAHLPVEITIVKGSEWDEQTKAIRRVSVKAKGSAA